MAEEFKKMQEIVNINMVRFFLLNWLKAALEADPMQKTKGKSKRQSILKTSMKTCKKIFYSYFTKISREMANEYMPENFGTVTMLYIDISINKIPIQVIYPT